MKSLFRFLGGPLFVILVLMLAALPPAASAHSTTHTAQRNLLPLSPYSAGYLMAQAVHSGKVHLPHATISKPFNAKSPPPCSPAPCVLPNVVASEGAGTGNPVNETPIVLDPRYNNHLITGANDYNCPTIQGFFASNDGGATFPNKTCLNALPGAFGEGDPGVGYNTKGTAYISGIDGGTQDGSDIVFESSTNNGATWSAPAIAVKPFFPGGLTDKDWLQVDTTKTSPFANALYISVTQFAPNNDQTITVSHSNDGGATWTEVPVDTVQLFPTVDQFSDLTVGKDGTVYATWMRCVANGPTGDCGGTLASFYMSKSTDGGTTWSIPSLIETANLAPDSCGAFYGCLPNTAERVSNIPAIGVDNSTGPNAGHLYVVTYNWTGAYMKVQVATSTDGGATWGAPVGVAPGSDTHDQFFPWLTVQLVKGAVGVTWLDRRNDPANVNYEAFAAISKNGSSFPSNVQIAAAPSNPFNDGFGSGFMGDYTGNYWKISSLYASWTDTSNGITAQDVVGGYRR